MKHRVKKGFTLVELIVVMAIFSILMVAVMALTGPVQRLFQKTALSEKTYSYANNIQLNLQGKLEYAEDVWVCTSDKIDFNGVDGVDNEDLAKLAEEFRSSHFLNTVGYDGTNVNYLKGNIHIIKLCNNACKDSKGKDVAQGQILHRTYSFSSTKEADKIISSSPFTEELALNDAFFNAQDAAFNFNYSLGTSNLKVVDLPDDPSLTGVDKNVTYRAMENDINDTPYILSVQNLGLSIVICESEGGSVDVPAGPGHKAYRAFASPAAVQMANLPLTNINERAKTVPAQFKLKGVQRPKMETVGNIELQAHGDTGDAFSCAYANTDFSFTNDIYFIYSYTDEMY